jgi:hypothetical protein
MTISGGVLRQLSDRLAELYASASAPGGLDYATRVVRVAARLVSAMPGLSRPEPRVQS